MQAINTALCSFGMSGKLFHAPFIDAHPGFNLYAVWERTKKLAQEQYPSVRLFRDYDTMLADSSIDLVVVNTPNNTHFDFAKKALLAGKHMLIEKAFTVTVSEAELLISLAEKMGKQLCVYQNRRYDSDFKTLQKVVQSGVLGNIIEAEFHFDRYRPMLSPKLHKESPLPGSGLLHDLGPHLIDQALLLFGMPQSVFASIRVTRPSSQVNDYFDILLFYQFVTVRLKSSMLVKESTVSYIINGDRGTFLKPRTDVQEDALKAGLKPLSVDWGTEPEHEQGLLNVLSNEDTIREYVTSEKGNYMELYDGLYQAIVHHTAPPVTGREGLQVMKIIEAALLSASTLKRVEVI
ncbi:MAG: Gfo/Idh/MocA family oxidoreductase [Bacteroidetes bacterium]|nr:Gfo/Idh/MocA family oxidoreductase [Bacteroidota bacterium]MBS1757203.1 Gfo/Idh/MocA family oxidoreductase [Bacteroidota bacterium]